VLAEFQTHCKNHFPEIATEPFLLACSGGIDSMVLALLCVQSNFNFSIAHCNFQLRAAESDSDALFVEKFSKKQGINFYSKRCNTVLYAKEHKVSIQVAARRLRYAWFAEIMQENSIKTLVTAHHADDNLETFIINLSRGTGIEGLHGMPVKTARISRPLLAFSRAQIEDYAKAEKLGWREDASNEETKYLRNKIRHDIVPTLKELHPTFLENFKTTQSYLADTSAIVADRINALTTTMFIEEDGLIKIAVTALQELKPLKSYLYLLFKDYGFTKAPDDIFNLLTAMSGKALYSDSHRLVKNRDYLLLERLKSDDNPSAVITKNDSHIKTPLKNISKMKR